jgi:hypothetical protein
MTTRTLRPLPTDEDTIRLVVLQPSNSEDAEIDCEIRRVKLSENPQYEALSYAWGTHDTDVVISANGRIATIWENLSFCLRRLRSSDTPRTLYIDALCINQTDLNEKNHQVKLMGQIFRTAQRVLVWLGEAADHSDELFDYLKHLKATVNSSRKHGSMIQAKDQLFKRSYWSRT